MARTRNPKTARDAKGRITALHASERYRQVGNFSDYRTRDMRSSTRKQVLHSAPIGGVRDANGRATGHNYTGANGELTKRQQYYDRRAAFGLVGG